MQLPVVEPVDALELGDPGALILRPPIDCRATEAQEILELPT